MSYFCVFHIFFQFQKLLPTKYHAKVPNRCSLTYFIFQFRETLSRLYKSLFRKSRMVGCQQLHIAGPNRNASGHISYQFYLCTGSLVTTFTLNLKTKCVHWIHCPFSSMNVKQTSSLDFGTGEVLRLLQENARRVELRWYQGNRSRCSENPTVPELNRGVRIHEDVFSFHMEHFHKVQFVQVNAL